MGQLSEMFQNQSSFIQRIMNKTLKNFENIKFFTNCIEERRKVIKIVNLLKLQSFATKIYPCEILQILYIFGLRSENLCILASFVSNILDQFTPNVSTAMFPNLPRAIGFLMFGCGAGSDHHRFSLHFQLTKISREHFGVQRRTHQNNLQIWPAKY